MKKTVVVMLTMYARGQKALEILCFTVQSARCPKQGGLLFQAKKLKGNKCPLKLKQLRGMVWSVLNVRLGEKSQQIRREKME